MYKITGKQQFGAVWGEGQCLAAFRKGAAHTNDPAKAKALEALGYTVTQEPDTAPVASGKKQAQKKEG